MDVGVIGSIANESARGVQVTSLFNYAGVNVSRGRVVGVQVSSVFNDAPDVRGGQVSLVNVGRKLVGPPIGLVNVADESDAAIGLLNIVGNGQHRLAFWTSDSASVNVGLKLGGRYVYSVLAAGFNGSGNGQRWLAGIGIGGHIPVMDRLSINADLVHWQITDGVLWPQADNSLTTLSAVANYSLYRHLTVFAGPTLNVLSSTVHRSDRFGLVTGTRLSAEGSPRNVLLWPGFVAGVQI